MTNGVRLDVDQDPAQVLVDELVRRLAASNEQVAPPSNHKRLAVFARDDGNLLIGGASGHTHWGWLFVNHLWVDERHRGKGLGASLMARVEDAAAARGAGSAHLDTFDFQALGFYRKLGYRIFGELADYPSGHTRYFLMKPLSVPP